MYAWCVERVADEKLEQWIWELNAPLPGRERAVSDAQQEEEGAAFMALMGQVRGTDGASR